MTLTNLIIAAMATWQIVEIVHHSELFAGWRSKWELRQSLFDRVMSCPFCLSIWVGAVCGIGLVYAEHLPLLAMLVFAFAISRGANLGNDLAHAYCRTPTPEDIVKDANATTDKPDAEPGAGDADRETAPLL